jgi:hypothetical protein
MSRGLGVVSGRKTTFLHAGLFFKMSRLPAGSAQEAASSVIGRNGYV